MSILPVNLSKTLTNCYSVALLCEDDVASSSDEEDVVSLSALFAGIVVFVIVICVVTVSSR